MQEKDTLQPFEEVLKLGIQTLVEDLDKYPPFDPNIGYPSKNDYFNQANNIGRKNLMWNQPSELSVLYYRQMLDEIGKYENVHQVRYNKGMLYANLGISQIKSGNIASGIAYLLSAEEEDKEISPEFKVLDTKLWKQFEYQTVYPFMMKHISQHSNNLPYRLTNIFLDKFFKKLETEDRIFIQGTIIALDQNVKLIQQIHSNPYTLGRLFSGLKDLCLITETLLRKKQQPPNIMMLDDLLKKAVRNYTTKNASSKNLEEFLKKLENSQGNSSVELRSLYILRLVRNFTGHHFDINGSIKSPTGKALFFELFEFALTHIIISILYLYYKNEI